MTHGTCNESDEMDSENVKTLMLQRTVFGFLQQDSC